MIIILKVEHCAIWKKQIKNLERNYFLCFCIEIRNMPSPLLPPILFEVIIGI